MTGPSSYSQNYLVRVLEKMSSNSNNQEKMPLLNDNNNLNAVDMEVLLSVSQIFKRHNAHLYKKHENCYLNP